MRKTAGIITDYRSIKDPNFFHVTSLDPGHPHVHGRSSEKEQNHHLAEHVDLKASRIYHHLPRGAFPKPERMVSFRHPLNGTMWYPKWKVHGEGVKRC